MSGDFESWDREWEKTRKRGVFLAAFSEVRDTAVFGF